MDRRVWRSPSVTRAVWFPAVGLTAGLFRLGGAIIVSGKGTGKQSRVGEVPPRGRADLRRLRLVREREIMRTSPEELADLPEDFWDKAEVVVPVKSAA